MTHTHSSGRSLWHPIPLGNCLTRRFIRPNIILCSPCVKIPYSDSSTCPNVRTHKQIGSEGKPRRHHDSHCVRAGGQLVWIDHLGQAKTTDDPCHGRYVDSKIKRLVNLSRKEVETINHCQDRRSPMLRRTEKKSETSTTAKTDHLQCYGGRMQEAADPLSLRSSICHTCLP